MTRKVIQVALNGVTGRMGYRQHLVRSLLAIREQGGIRLDDGTVLYPEPVLVGRSEDRLRAIAERHGLPRWTTSLDEVLGDPDIDVYFDTQVTSARETALAQAIRWPERQVRLARLVRQPTTDVTDLDRVDATNVGRLLAASQTTDIVDAHVVICARRADQPVVTTDPGDLRELDPALRLIPL